MYNAVKIVVIIWLLSISSFHCFANDSFGKYSEEQNYSEYEICRFLFQRPQYSNAFIWSKIPVIHFYSLDDISDTKVLECIKLAIPNLPLYVYREYKDNEYLYHIFSKSYNIEQDIKSYHSLSPYAYIAYWQDFNLLETYQIIGQFINIDFYIDKYKQNTEKYHIKFARKQLSSIKNEIKPLPISKHSLDLTVINFKNNPIKSSGTQGLAAPKTLTNRYYLKSIPSYKLIEGSIHGTVLLDLELIQRKFGLTGYIAYITHDDDILSTQLSFFNSTKKEENKSSSGVNFNLSYRRYLGTWGVGINSGFDFSLKDKHSKMGIGCEVYHKTCYLSANCYIPVSKWKNATNNKFRYKPTFSVDTNIRIYNSLFNPITVDLSCMLDIGELYISKKNHTKNNIYTFIAKVNYSPVELLRISTGCSYCNADESISYLLEFKIIFNSNLSIKKQTDVHKITSNKDIKLNMTSNIVDHNPQIKIQQDNR